MSKSRLRAARLLRLQTLLLLLLLAVIVGHKLHAWGFNVLSAGFLVSVVGLLLIGVVSLVALLVARIKSIKGVGGVLFASVVLALLPLAVILLLAGGQMDKPAIHDITTDWHDVPEFKAAENFRTPDQNSLFYEGGDVTRLQRQHYPHLQPLLVDVPAQQVFDAAKKLVKDRGWKILRSDRRSGEIEAVSETALIGFQDDVIIRIDREDDRTRIDMRSNSRVGRGDLGANAQRIEAFLGDLERRLASTEG